MTVRIVSYNILVPVYADRPEYYTKCDPKYLKTNHRMNLIINELEQEINHHENTIICLQELSLPVLPELELFFRRMNYSFFHHLYGTRSNDYMGVGMAIPLSMKLDSISFHKMGDRIRSMARFPPNQNTLMTWGWNLYQSLLHRFLSPVSDPWKTAMNRINTLICSKVIIDGKPLFIGTYHMPCLYKEPDTMAIHSSMIKDLMFELSEGHPFILTGDFNIKPRDISYRSLTEQGFLDRNFPSTNDYQITYRPNIEQVLKSAYREKNGAEPVYTDFSHTPHSPNFCETLDYIFFHGPLMIKDVLELPDQPIGESYPDETHPSDHLLIAATFQFP